MTAPTLVAYSKSNAATTYSDGSTVSVASSFSWVAGDVVVVTGIVEDADHSFNSPTNLTNLTFTAVSAAAGDPNADCWGRAWYAVATGSGSGTVSAVINTLTGSRSGQLQAWHYTDTDGVGNTTAAANTGTTPTQALTASTDSAVITAWGDWNAVAAGSTGVTASGYLAERADTNVPAIYTVWGGDWIEVTSGADNWGTASGTGRNLTFAGTIEVLAATGTDLTGTTTSITATTSSALVDGLALTAVAFNDSQIDLDWNAVGGATGYDIERDAGIILYDHPANSYSDTGLVAATEYTYRVRAVF